MNLFRTLRYQHYQTYDPAIPSLKVKSPFKNIFSYFKDNPLLCIFAGLFLIGMLAGIVLLYHADGQLREWLHILLGGYLEKRYEQSFSQIAALSFGSSVFLLLILFFCGFCTISQPIILLLVLFRGLGYGCVFHFISSHAIWLYFTDLRSQNFIFIIFAAAPESNNTF